MHDALDPDDGDAAVADAANESDQRLALVIGQAAGNLVEQQQARARTRARAPVRAACGRAASANPAGRLALSASSQSRRISAH